MEQTTTDYDGWSDTDSEGTSKKDTSSDDTSDDTSDDASDEDTSDKDTSNGHKPKEDTPSSSTSGNKNTKAETAETVDLKRLLQQHVGDRGNEASRPSIPSRSLFQHLSQLLCSSPEVTIWLASRQNECFVLRLPRSLNNALVFSSITASLRLTQPGSQCVTAMPGGDIATPHGQSEFLLASLCYQLARLCETDIGTGIRNEMGLSFKGHSPSWRAQVLWALLRAYITHVPGQELAIVVGLSSRLQAAGRQQCIAVCRQLSDYAKGMDKSIKILLIVDASIDTDLVAPHSAPHSFTVSLDDGKVQESLVSDLVSCLDGSTAESRLFAKDATIASTIRRHVKQPMLVFSYIRSLGTRLWTTKAQLSTDTAIFSCPESSSGSLLSLVLDATQQRDRAVVADALGFLRVCGRPMKKTELQIALAMASLPPDSEQLDAFQLLDIDFDILHALAGIVHVEDGRLQLLSQFWEQPLDTALEEANKSSTASAGQSWLHTNSDANMRLAVACLRYISHCSTVPKQGDGGNLVRHWPFLEYAITFWHHHYSEAYQKGSEEDDDVRRMFAQKPEMLRLWLELQDAVNYWGLSATKKGEAEQPADADTTSAAAMASKFKVGFPEAVSIAAHAARMAPVMGGDTLTASIWSAWVCRGSHASDASASEWLKETKSVPDEQSLLKALPYAVKPTFQLLGLSDAEFRQAHAKEILEAAVRQGETSIANDGFDLLGDKPDSSLVVGLPIACCVRAGNVATFERAFAHWRPAAEVSAKDASREWELTCIAMWFGQLAILDQLLSWLLICGKSVLFENDTLNRATFYGRRDSIARLLHRVPDLVKSSGKDRVSTALTYACIKGYCGIFSDLLDQDGIVGEEEGNEDTVLHIAVRSKSVEVVKLLFDASSGTEARKKLVAAAPAYITMLGAYDTSPLSEAVALGIEPTAAFLLQKIPPGTDLTDKRLLHTAAESDSLGVLKQVLEIDGMDINMQDDKGLTALHLACRSGCVDVIRELLKRGADAWMADMHKEPPFTDLVEAASSDTADVAEMTEIAAELLQHSHSAGSLVHPLIYSAMKGKDWAVTMLLDAGADKDAHGFRDGPLLTAASNGHEEVVRTLLLRRAALDKLGHDGHTPLGSAAGKGHTAVVRILLDAGADRQKAKVAKEGPMYLAAVNGHDSTVELLLKRGLKLPLTADGCPLDQLVRKRRMATMRLILEQQPEFKGSAVLVDSARVALRRNDTEMLAMLFDHGVDPSEAPARSRFGSALHECAYYGNIKMARFLVAGPRQYCSASLIASPYDSPLIAAVSRPYSCKTPDDGRAARRLQQQKDMIDFLVHREGDVHLVGCGRFGTVLHAAAANGSPDLVEHVVRTLGLAVTLVDAEGRNAAHLACTQGVYETQKLARLAELERLAGVSSNARLQRAADAHGRKPLHLASGRGATEAVRQLLRDAVVAEDINCTDADGWTPLHWACRQGDVAVVELLVAAGAEMYACTARRIDADTTRNKNRWTPWEVAVFHGNDSDALAAVLGVRNRRTVVQRGVQQAEVCDSCFARIWGTRYPCETCRFSYGLCSKCFRRAARLHSPVHAFWNAENKA